MNGTILFRKINTDNINIYTDKMITLTFTQRIEKGREINGGGLLLDFDMILFSIKNFIFRLEYK